MIKRENFILAVVAGLEDGFETVIRLIPDPLKALDWQPGTGLTLVGVSTIPVKLSPPELAKTSKSPRSGRHATTLRNDPPISQSRSRPRH